MKTSPRRHWWIVSTKWSLDAKLIHLQSTDKDFFYTKAPIRHLSSNTVIEKLVQDTNANDFITNRQKQVRDILKIWKLKK